MTEMLHRTHECWVGGFRNSGNEIVNVVKDLEDQKWYIVGASKVDIRKKPVVLNIKVLIQFCPMCGKQLN